MTEPRAMQSREIAKGITFTEKKMFVALMNVMTGTTSCLESKLFILEYLKTRLTFQVLFIKITKTNSTSVKCL